MMRLFVNGLAASAGGGVTYLRNVLPCLSRRCDVQTIVALRAELREQFRGLPNITCVGPENNRNAALRFLQELALIPGLLREERADLLLSVGNFAIPNLPVRQILLSRNALYTSGNFYRDLWRRREFGMLLDTRLKAAVAKRSVQWADVTVAPTKAFASDLAHWAGKEVLAVHHGFDRQGFFQDQSPLAAEIEDKLNLPDEAVRLLHVSHYNYYRNFETLFRALSILRSRLKGRRVKLFLTCRLGAGQSPGTYKTAAAARLLHELGVAGDVIQLGAIPYLKLHHLYRACHIYVTAAYAESFAHPLVEAMACGLPIAASNIPVHREICEDGARYFA